VSAKLAAGPPAPFVTHIPGNFCAFAKHYKVSSIIFRFGESVRRGGVLRRHLLWSGPHHVAAGSLHVGTCSVAFYLRRLRREGEGKGRGAEGHVVTDSGVGGICQGFR